MEHQTIRNFFDCTRPWNINSLESHTWLQIFWHQADLSTYCYRLLKTIRNAWYNSQANSTWSLVVNKYLCTYYYLIMCVVQNQGCDVKWACIVGLSEKVVAYTSLYNGKNLMREHLNLTSYSHVNVSLAAQVCIYT